MGDQKSWQLSKIAKVQGGFAFRSRDFSKVGVPVVKIGNVTGGGSVSYQDLDCVSEDIARSADNWKTRENDTLIAMTGANVGKVAKVGCNDPVALINQRVGRFVPHVDQGFSKEYIHCLVSSKQAYEFFRNAAYGSAQPNISARLIEMLPIPKYERDQANRLGAVFSALDDKIALNRRMNETLEGLARALFKDWFVDFGPTRAKASGAKPDLPPETLSLFPDRLDDNGLPEGWEEKPLSAFFSILGGGTPKTKEPAYWGGNIPWYSVVDVPSGADVYVHDTEKKITDRGVQESSAKMVREGTTIISARGTVGKLAMAAQEMTFNQSCYGLQGVGDVGDCFTYLAAQHMVSRLQAMAHGSVFSTITRATFQSLNLAMPKGHVLEAFENAVLPIFEKTKANGKESRTLAQTRDLLLPKLMSGALRVGAAEEIVEGAL